jgi:hypothetical protein
MLPFRLPVQQDMEGLIEYAFSFSQRLLRHRHTQANTLFNRATWMRAVGSDPDSKYIRLFSFVGLQEQRMWKQEAFVKLAVFSMVLSDFIGDDAISKLRQRAQLARDILMKRLVSLDAEHMSSETCTFSARAFNSISRVFALTLVIENLPVWRSCS